MSIRIAWLAVAFVVAFFLIGVPYWRIPYNRFDLTHTELLPGAIMLGTMSMVLVAFSVARARLVLGVMSICTVAVDCISIVRDTSLDPTTHNLVPFELVAAWVLGMGFVLPGVLIGVGGKMLIRAQDATG